MSLITPTCPGSCEYQIAAIDFDECAPKVFFGEITHIYIASGDAEPLTDVEDLAAWTARLSDDGTDPDVIRDFHVAADLPASTAEEIVISLGRKVYSPASHVINVDIDDISDATYEFGRTTSCNTSYRVWFATPSHIYGGTDGILALVNLRPVIERGIKSLNKLTGTITWEAQFSPERHDNPFAS